MDTRYQEFDTFIAEWATDLARTVGMYAGENAEVASAGARSGNKNDAQQTADYLWWKQVIEGDTRSAIWVGASEQTWSALGSGTTPDESKQTYLEMLAQAQQGAVSALSGKVGKALRCLDGEEQAPSVLSSLIVCEINVTLKGETLTPLIIAAETEINAILPPKLHVSGPAAFDAEEDQTFGPMLDRLMDLELPLSVALGRAALPIGEILKMTSGSLIELDRDVTEYVELMVHGTVVARGEVVSVKGNYGIRIKEIMSRKERLALHRGASNRTR